MSVDSASTNKVIPLFLRPHQDKEDINYMRHTLKEWDFDKLKAPIYFYQPTVKPNSQGGTVKDTYAGPRKNKEFYAVRKEFIKRPEAESWMLYTSDGVVFKGAPDTLSSMAVIFPGSDQFIIQIANNSIRITDGKELDPNLDIDTVIKRDKQAAEAKSIILKKEYSFIYDAMKKKENERLKHAKELRETGDEDIAMGDSDDNEEKDEDDFNNDENAADVDDARSDDDEDIPDDIENIFTEEPEELNQNQFSSDEEESQSSSDEDSEGEDGHKKKKKKKKGQQQTPEKTESAAKGDNPNLAKPQSTEKIVDDILGPKVLKEDELVRYMMDVGLVTLKQIYQKFKDRLVTIEQKEAFKKLIVRKLQQTVDNGIKYVKLKDKK